MPISNSQFQWARPKLQQRRTISISLPSHLDALGTGLPTLDGPIATVSPSYLNKSTSTGRAYFDHSLLPQNIQQQHRTRNMHPEIMHNQQQGSNSLMLAPPSLSNFSSTSPSQPSAFVTGSARQSSATPNPTESITDATRQALLASLGHRSVSRHNHRKYSPGNISSPLSLGADRNTVREPNLASTADMRRHAYTHSVLRLGRIISSHRGKSAHVGTSQNSIIWSGGCLVLAMAAVGALYKYDHAASKELFDAAKRLISLYLEERREADMSATVNGQTGD
ncbi:hypothetical protein LTR17_026114 [Elasticomyces elasticus]|nr:hypothetical protein LTR17_026114 [Elasticomyces elasticus]